MLTIKPQITPINPRNTLRRHLRLMHSLPFGNVLTKTTPQDNGALFGKAVLDRGDGYLPHVPADNVVCVVDVSFVGGVVEDGGVGGAGLGGGGGGDGRDGGGGGFSYFLEDFDVPTWLVVVLLLVGADGVGRADIVDDGGRRSDAAIFGGGKIEQVVQVFIDVDVFVFHGEFYRGDGIQARVRIGADGSGGGHGVHC